MEFWGVEVKGGEPLACRPGEGYLVHLSQACLGERKKEKENESVCIYAKIADKKFVIGILSYEKIPQLSFDLVFEKDFELSHTGKIGSVHFTGYKVAQEDQSDDSEFDDELGGDYAVAANPGIPVAQAATAMKTDSKLKGKLGDSSDSDTSDDSDDDMPVVNGEDEEDESIDEEDESDEEEDDSEEETPKKVQLGKKKSAESATKTPIPEKKAKLLSPQKTDGKKVGGHIPTPYPNKKTEKKPTNSDQKKENTPKSFSCLACNRSFGSENALQSHSKAKHGAA